jgi:hypothetical protein
MSDEDILDIRRRAFEDAASIADEFAADNKRKAAQLHRRSNKQARLYGEDSDAADQTKISAQVLDMCAIEAASIATAIRNRGPREAEAGK